MIGAARVALLGVVFAALLVGAYLVSSPHPRIVARVAAVTARYSAAKPAAISAVSGPATVSDSISPERPIQIDTSTRASSEWLTARPRFQYSHSSAQRGGIEPCAIADGDTSAFEDWLPLAPGRVSMPRGAFLDASGAFGLVIHLQGDDPVRRELILSKQPFVLFSLTLPHNQSYAPLFSGTPLLASIVASVERVVSARTGKAAHAGRVALSAWSAGFVGIEAALARAPGKDVDAVILVDGLHAPRNDAAELKAQLQPFVAYAARAAAGDRFMFVSHSSIDPPDFASTTECAHYLIASLGGTPQPVKRADPLGLELVEYFSRGDFNVRGYAGNDKADHCAQLGVLRDAFAALGRRWGSKPAE